MLPQPPLWLILVAFIGAIGPLVIIHELGHYWVARLFGVGAETFSIGFGREVAGWSDRRGTRWKIGWLPLGGYVRFIGDDSAASNPAEPHAVAEENRAQSFHWRPVWQRFLIVLAGPLANFALAILIFAGFFATVGYPSTPNLVGQVVPGSAAARAGILAGDRIVAIDGRGTATFEDIGHYAMMRPGERVSVQLERRGHSQLIRVTLGADTEQDRFGQKFRVGRLGILNSAVHYQPLSIPRLVPAAAKYTVAMTGSMIEGLGQIVAGRRSVKELGGPLKMAQIAGQQASLGGLVFVQLLALFSINLGFINLLPVPMLDGGHLVFYAIEGVRRRPVGHRAQGWAFRGGLAALLALILFTTVNDLASFGLWERLGRLIG